MSNQRPHARPQVTTQMAAAVLAHGTVQYGVVTATAVHVQPGSDGGAGRPAENDRRRTHIGTTGRLRGSCEIVTVPDPPDLHA